MFLFKQLSKKVFLTLSVVLFSFLTISFLDAVDAIHPSVMGVGSKRFWRKQARQEEVQSRIEELKFKLGLKKELEWRKDIINGLKSLKKIGGEDRIKDIEGILKSYPGLKRIKSNDTDTKSNDNIKIRNNQYVQEMRDFLNVVSAKNGALKNDQKKLASDLEKKASELFENMSSSDKVIELSDQETLEYLLGLSDKKVESLLNEQGEMIKLINSQFGCLGDAIARGIAGKEAFEMVEDLRVGDDMLKGLKTGIMLRGSVAFGDAIGDSIERYVRILFGSTIGKLEEFISFVYRGLFHDSCKPFTVEEVARWNSLISSDLHDIERMMKNAEKYDSRGKSEILREYESDETKTEEVINLWQDFVEDLALTCEELAKEIEMRQGYYEQESGFGITSCTNHLKNKLLKTRSWLLRVKTLKELSNTPEARSIIPAMKKSLDNYFVNLAEQVKPKNSKKVNLKASSRSSMKKNMWGHDNDYDDDIPGFMR